MRWLLLRRPHMKQLLQAETRSSAATTAPLLGNAVAFTAAASALAGRPTCLA